MASSSSSTEKHMQGHHEEQIERLATYDRSFPASNITEAHRNYLIERHGTFQLDPVPDFTDADPLNWSLPKKTINILLVAFHAMMATFTAASIQSAFENIAEDLNVSLQRTTYLTSLFIAILGGAPLFWQPISKRYGRRPVFLISLVIGAVGNIGCARSPSYATMAVCRAITAFFISPAAAIGSGVVKEVFFKRDRARYMGIWTLMVTIGVPAAPFIFGFLAQRVTYRWIYWTLAITNAVQFVLYLFLGHESRYMRGGDEATKARSLFLFRRIDSSKITAYEFIRPFRFFGKLCVVLPAFAYSIVFLFTSVMITVEIPQLFGEKFHFNTQQLGLQFLGTIIGSIIGEQIGGAASDYWMNRRAKRGVHPQPEYRLWLSYLGYGLSICGVVVFLVQIENAPALHWDVSPIVGAGIAAAGNQIVTTVLITYAIDCYIEDAASVGVFITFVRQILGFIGPFW
ncbi:hypothetical protein LTR70_006521 [Exophiala xenobiotica]|uniref:Major facilitator superfamily (MFS) profile domain-containing protein n=1 Tax=Lithohypha guttulata TaxID=1690604 RepID=A0ABR0K137_9EURO|nr:hypothetical protein LTR24_008045 [Lithohypha guttulata]KAK5315969.1 hypothetical protein LTR70_006521 [Exophiala xenobiotica]